MDLKEEEALSGDPAEHWYYSSKAAALLELVRGLPVGHVLDVGAGSGFFAKHLLAHTSAKDAICIDSNYEQDADEVVAGKPIRFRRDCPHARADLVLMMDVLEHVDDDRQLLGTYIAKVPAGARFLITVPAFSFLWSSHDVFLGHKRRYTLNQTIALVREAGLQLEHGSYFFGLVFPLAAAIRLLFSGSRTNPRAARSQLRDHGPLTNRLLREACTLDLTVLFRRNRLAGLSVFCLARKL